eukprot:UN05698
MLSGKTSVAYHMSNTGVLRCQGIGLSIPQSGGLIINKVYDIEHGVTALFSCDQIFDVSTGKKFASGTIMARCVIDNVVCTGQCVSAIKTQKKKRER